MPLVVVDEPSGEPLAEFDSLGKAWRFALQHPGARIRNLREGDPELDDLRIRLPFVVRFWLEE
jgi:hypothetical protein